MKKILLLITFLSSLTTTYAQQAGTLDVSFGLTGTISKSINSRYSSNSGKVVIQSDGKIIVAGSYNVYTPASQSMPNSINVTYFSFVRYNQNGTLDNTFGSSGVANISVYTTYNDLHGFCYFNDVAIQTDDKIVAIGNGTGFNFVVRINSDGSLDNTFDGDGIKDLTFISGKKIAQLFSIVIQPNGKIIVVGDVIISTNLYNEYDFAVIRLDPDGSLDLGFDGDGSQTTNFGQSDQPTSVTLQADGKIVVAGMEDIMYGHVIQIARYNSSGALDTSFDNDGKQTINGTQKDWSPTVKIQADNKILVGYRGNPEDSNFILTRLNANGSLDLSFDGDGTVISSTSDGYLTDLLIQSDAKIIAIGGGGLSRGLCVYRYNSDGSLDSTFNGTGVYSINPASSSKGQNAVIQADGKIVVGSYNYNIGGFVVRRLHGVTNFNSNNGKMITQIGISNEQANAIALRPNGKIITGGYAFNAVNGSSNNDFALVGYNADGSLDSTFGNNALVKTDINAGSADEIKAIAIQPDGKIIAVGSTTLSSSDFVVARYLADGSGLDATFGTNGKIILDFPGSDDVAYAVVLQTDGTILVTGGTINSLNVDVDVAIIKLTSSGVLDSTFDGDGKLVADMGNGYNYLIGVGIAVQLDGKIVVGVYANNLDFSSGNFTAGDFGVIRLNTNGSFDTSFDGDGKVTASFGTNSIDDLRGLVLQPDGKIVAGGNTNFVGGQDDFAMMRFNSDGSLDNTFGSGGKVLADINSNLTDWSTGIALYPSGKIAIAGQAGFGTIGVARFNANGTIDNDFDGDGKMTLEIGYAIDQVNAMVLQTDGKIILAGNYGNGANDDFALVSLPACITSTITLSNPSDNYPNATLPNPQIGKSITATNLVNSSANVIYRSPSSITLNPGFKAVNGAIFKTEIVGCTY